MGKKDVKIIKIAVCFVVEWHIITNFAVVGENQVKTISS